MFGQNTDTVIYKNISSLNTSIFMVSILVLKYPGSVRRFVLTNNLTQNSAPHLVNRKRKTAPKHTRIILCH